MRTSLLIAMPVYRGIDPLAVTTLFDLRTALEQHGITHGFRFQTGADLPMQRATLAGHCLWPTPLTHLFGLEPHLLFFDSDISFKPDLVLRMLAADRDVLGCACRVRGAESRGGPPSRSARGSIALAARGSCRWSTWGRA